MAARPGTIKLSRGAYDLVAREAARRGLMPDQVVAEIVWAHLAQLEAGDLGAALDALAELRDGLPPIDAAALVREGRCEPEARGA